MREIWADIDLRDRGKNLVMPDIHGARQTFRARHIREPENVCVTGEQWRLLGKPTLVLGMGLIVRSK